MGRRRRARENQKNKDTVAEYTLPSSRSQSFSSSSSSDFEFSISISPRKSSTDLLCPADDLFYKGQLLPLHLSPRISMVRTLLLSSSYSAPRDSTASTTSSSSFLTNDCDSSRPSSATDDDNHIINNNAFTRSKKANTTTTTNNNNKYFSFSRFSSVFRKPRGETEIISANSSEPSSVKRMGNTAREVIRKYLKKVKNPLHGKCSQKQQKTVPSLKTERSANGTGKKKEITESSANNSAMVSSSYSFSGNLLYPRRRSTYVSSCPSSMRSSPTHSGVLSRGANYSDASTMEELQSAIQGAIAHCKNSLLQNHNKTVVSAAQI